VAGLAVTAVLVADSSGLLGPKLAMILDDSAQLGGGVFAAVCCLYGARRTSGVERAWRRLMAALARLGCGFGQGHLYGRPAPMATMAPPAALVARERM
jgi:hypothetical protein